MNNKKEFLFKNKFICYIIILFFIYLSFSCSATNGDDFENSQSSAILISPGELKTKINEKSLKLISLDCEGDITIDSPELNSSGSIILSILKPDSIYTKLEGPFGISIARMLITRNNFIYHNIRENYVIKGSSTPLNLGSILRLKVNFDDLINGYTSTFYFNDTTSSNATVSLVKNKYVLKISEAEHIKVFTINPKDFNIEKYDLLDKAGKIMLLIEYSDFETINNIITPKSIFITNPNEKQHLWINLEKKIINSNKLKFKITIPKSAKIIEWE